MDVFNKLIELYSSINDIYLNLCKKEMQGLFGSNEFKCLVEEIKEKLKKEKELFLELFECDDYEYVKTIIFEEEGPLILRMRDYIKTYESLNIVIDECDDEDTIYNKKLSMKISKLSNSCAKNIFLTCSSYMQEFIELVNNSLLRERIITLKYYHALTKHDIESMFIDYNFKVPKEIYVDVYLVAETLGIDISKCDEIIFDSYLSVMIGMISQIMTFNDSDYDDCNKLAVIINATFMLQSCLALISEKDYSYKREEINNMIDELRNVDNKKSASIIYDIISNRNEYRKKVRKISFRSNIC